METVYLVCLIFGGFFLAVSIFAGTETDADLSLDVDADVDIDVDVDGEASHRLFSFSASETSFFLWHFLG